MGHFQPMSNIGQRIKEARKSLGLSQEEFAAALSKQSARIISRGAIGNWELGKGISRDNLAEVARLCGVSIDWLQLNEPLKKTDKSSLFTTRQKSTLQSVRKGWWWLKDTPIPPDDLQENQGPVNVGVFS